MLYVATFAFFLAVFLLLYALFIRLFGKKIKVDERLEYIETMDEIIVDDAQKSFGERVVIPFFNSLGKRFLSLSPNKANQRKRQELERAGYLKYTTYERLVARRSLTTIVLTMGVGLILSLIKVRFVLIFFAVLWIFIFIQIVIRFSTKAAITSRSTQMIKALPYSLDLITVSVEAGLSLDGAIARIVNNIPGPLSEEFAKTLKEMRMGIEKKVALRNMSERCDVRDLSVLINALIQADELGVSLGKVLRIESAQLREKRRQAAREKAMKAPVKILFPLIMFIFPAIFVIILGPAVIQMIEMFR